MRDDRPGAPSRPLVCLVRPDVRQKMSGYALLRSLDDSKAALVVLDPQYRSVLDAMKYGNEGARQKARARLPQMTEGTIAGFLKEAERVLKPSGHLALWVDKFMLGEGRHRDLLRLTALKVVDLIHWNKTRPGMGKRTRIVSEYVVVAQKPPIRAKGFWADRRFSDSAIEAVDRERHPHAKPHGLTERLIRAVTKRGDLVVDPCAGGYGVLDACLVTGRRFVGCDLT